MSTLKIGENLNLEIGDFIVIAWGSLLEYGWYCGQGKDKCSLQYYSLHSPGGSLELFEQYERGEPVSSWVADTFKKHKGFTSKCFYKSYITSYYEKRILKPANPDDLFTNPKQIEEYNKSKEALIKIKFLNK
jgi:hypothetical protein